MKKIFTLVMLLSCLLGKSFAQECEIPPNYFQNPNFEHRLSPLVWTGSFDWISYGAWQPYTHPEFWVTDTTEAHSGSKALVITADSWIWPGVTTVGFEEKSMKMSFWYKAPLGKMGFWMFMYRDAKLTPEEIRPPLQEQLVGADTAYITITAGTTDEEAIYFEMPAAQDWTYFEYKFDYPGAIPGPGLTLMFWSQFTVGFIDDAYYGIDFDCVYNGEEEIGLVNPDFEAEGLGAEWLVNSAAADLPRFLSDENHTDPGAQSLNLWEDYTATYYMPVMGTEGQDLNLNFWYKGNEGTVKLNFYEDYGITTGNFAVPEGATLVLDTIAEYVEAVVDTLVTEIPFYNHSIILESTPTGENITVLDTVNVDTELMGIQDFENVDEAPFPIEDKWSNYFYDDWASVMPANNNFYSPYRALYLPGDPDWTGVWGTIPDFVDDKAYSISFMYKGPMQFDLYIGRDFKYPLDIDPDNIMPANATITDKNAIHWDLTADDWTEFSFAFEIDTWFADSAITTPVGLGFEFAGAYEWDVTGYVDDFQGRFTVGGLGTESAVLEVPQQTHTYALDSMNYDSTLVTAVVDTLYTYEPLSLLWNLPAAADWTQFNHTWTNPTGDIGGTLTMVLAATGTENDTLIYFDDFYFGAPQVGIRDIDKEAHTIDVFPNPAKDRIMVNTTVEMTRAAFYNSVGQLVKTINKPERQMNISALSEGLYFLRITDKEGQEYKARFIKR